MCLVPLERASVDVLMSRSVLCLLQRFALSPNNDGQEQQGEGCDGRTCTGISDAGGLERCQLFLQWMFSFSRRRTMFLQAPEAVGVAPSADEPARVMFLCGSCCF